MMRPITFPVSELHAKLESERRALLIQLGGYTCKGQEHLYSDAGKKHLDKVTERKQRRVRFDFASLAAAGAAAALR